MAEDTSLDGASKQCMELRPCGPILLIHIFSLLQRLLNSFGPKEGASRHGKAAGYITVKDKLIDIEVQLGRALRLRHFLC